PEAEERGRGERNQHEVAGIRSDARDDPDEYQDIGHRLARRDQHELVDQRADQPRLLGDADAEHRDDDHADRREAHEILDDAREHEAEAVGRHQALRGHGVVDERLGLRVDRLERDGGAEQVKDVRKQYHDADQHHEDDDRMRYSIADPLDDVEKPLDSGFSLNGLLAGIEG